MHFTIICEEKERKPQRHLSLCQLLFDSLIHYGSRDGAVVRVLASHQFGLGLNPSVDATCGLSWLMVLYLAPRNFSPGTPVFPSLGIILIFQSKIQNVLRTFFQNNTLFIQTQGYLIGDQHPANRACLCFFFTEYAKTEQAKEQCSP